MFSVRIGGYGKFGPGTLDRAVPQCSAVWISFERISVESMVIEGFYFWVVESTNVNFLLPDLRAALRPAG